MKQELKLTRISNESLSDESKEQIKQWAPSKQKLNRNSKHEYFLLLTYLVSIRSTDPQTQCGCVLVNDDGTIIGTGYNGFVQGIRDNVLPNLRPDKYPFMIHSEHNAILACARHGISCDGAIAYVTGPPCCACLQYLYQAGIKAIYYANNNIANMTANKEYEIQFEILTNLMPNLNIYCIDLDKTMLEKIEKIKSTRTQ